MQISNDWQPEPKTRLNLVKNRRYLGMAKVSVVGAGSWGTALAMLLCNNGHDTMLWSHREEQAEELRTARENKAKLPGVKIPEEIHVTSDLSEALIDKDVIVMAVPSVAVRTTAKKMSSHIRYGQVIVNVAKGIEGGQSDDTDRYDRRRNSKLSGMCAFRTKPCRRGKPWSSDNLCSRGKDKSTCGISAEYFYEFRISGLYQPGYF